MLKALGAALDRPEPILNSVGALLVMQSGKAFREERMGGVKWKTRAETKMVPNWPGILADFAAGKSAPPARRLEKGKVLQDTGRLKSSVSWRIVNQDTVEAGSNLPYAAVLHSGGESQTVTVTKLVQERLWKWIKSRRAGAKRANASDKTKDKADQANTLTWLLNKNLTGQRLTVKHPPRPIVGVPKELTQKVEEFFGVTIKKGAP